MNTYKDFPHESLGFSDIASVLLRGCDAVAELHFGGDGSYSAYVVTKETEIGEHYSPVFSCRTWLWVYDDDECMLRVSAPEITVYRAGDYGCVIYAPGGKFRWGWEYRRSRFPYAK